MKKQKTNKTIGVDAFCARMDEIFKTGMITKAQIIDAYNKSINEAMPTVPRFLSPSPLEREWQEHCLKLMFPDYPNACSWQILNSLIINTSKRTELGIPEYDEWFRNRRNSSKKPNNCEEGGKE